MAMGGEADNDIERLRWEAALGSHHECLLREAADEIERLRKKVADLEAALMREEPAMYAVMTELQMRRKWLTEQLAALDRELEEHMEC